MNRQDPLMSGSIGILGAGKIGSAIAHALASRDISATLASRRGPDALRALAANIGPSITAGSITQAAAAELVFVAIPWDELPAALRGLPDFGGRIVVDATNPIGAGFRPADLQGRASTAVFAQWVPGARVVKAFNHLPPPLLSTDPLPDGGRRVLFYAGDDHAAKQTVAQLIERLGFFGIDLGTIDGGGRLAEFPGGPLPALDLVKRP